MKNENFQKWKVRSCQRSIARKAPGARSRIRIPPEVRAHNSEELVGYSALLYFCEFYRRMSRQTESNLHESDRFQPLTNLSDALLYQTLARPSRSPEVKTDLQIAITEHTAYRLQVCNPTSCNLQVAWLPYIGSVWPIQIQNAKMLHQTRPGFTTLAMQEVAPRAEFSCVGLTYPEWF